MPSLGNSLAGTPGGARVTIPTSVAIQTLNRIRRSFLSLFSRHKSANKFLAFLSGMKMAMH
jgi:hypothetical protein